MTSQHRGMSASTTTHHVEEFNAKNMLKNILDTFTQDKIIERTSERFNPCWDPDHQ